MRLLVALALIASGCLDSPAAPDASASVDLSPPSADLFGIDYAGDYNCAQLNACESDPLCQNMLCQQHCHAMATPSAEQRDRAVQQCFNQFCPTSPGAICALDGSGQRSPDCKQCLANSQLPMTSPCTPPGAAECHACFAQAQACKNDL